jgi:NAD(P)-dependent dehydrogenase (short-subunit alcohol dehydrogenase family)
MMNTIEKFRLDNRVAVITGGAGLLGVQHAEAIAEAGGIPVLWDINEELAVNEAERIQETHKTSCIGMKVDITSLDSVRKGMSDVLSSLSCIDILINNAANDPKVKSNQGDSWSRYEYFSLEMWNQDIAVGLTGAFFCSQAIGTYMAQNKGGVILNIASDLSVISPDQRLYRKAGVADEQQYVKPVTYSVVKHGLVGLTKYLSTYWVDKNVRVNAISPGGVYTNQPEEFVKKLTKLIPMGHMANVNEYKAAVIFMCSDASSYMTGQNVSIDGGRTVW